MKFFCITIFGILAFVLTGCGSQNAASNVDGIPQASGTPTNVNPTTNSNVVPVAPPPAANMNVNSAGMIETPMGRKLTESNSAETVKNTTRPAPDDSEFSASMDKNGQVVETRVFHKHPQLAKVVRTWLNVNDKKIDVYLKNGKVITLPGDKLDNINSVPASTILDAAGIKPQPAHPANPRRQKKSGKISSSCGWCIILMAMEKFSVICPCCEANLTIDAQTGAILAHEEKKKAHGSFEELAGELNKQKELREQLFAQEMSSMKDRERLLEEKFKEAMKKAESAPNTPFRNPLDLD